MADGQVKIATGKVKLVDVQVKIAKGQVKKPDGQLKPAKIQHLHEIAFPKPFSMN